MKHIFYYSLLLLPCIAFGMEQQPTQTQLQFGMEQQNIAETPRAPKLPTKTFENQITEQPQINMPEIAQPLSEESETPLLNRDGILITLAKDPKSEHLVRQLIHMDADVDYCNEKNQTALVVAAQISGNKQTVERLLFAMANRFIEESFGLKIQALDLMAKAQSNSIKQAYAYTYDVYQKNNTLENRAMLQSLDTACSAWNRCIESKNFVTGPKKLRSSVIRNSMRRAICEFLNELYTILEIENQKAQEQKQ
ncbi:MAG: hypothetical protein UU47_C0007G0031 [candidate division TM6 bacterium GW2011_GWE2_41_16]|nr:MAG: hypothetical protein UU47_C0007G0031 [candidate division TM6 bacterium GW2011_GWE2_41_16]